MVRPPINKQRYVTAFILTCVIFLIGILVGYSITGLRLKYTNDIEAGQRLEYESLQAQTLYLSSLVQQQNCPALVSTLEKNIDEAEKTAQRLEDYIQDTTNEEDFTITKRRYILAQIRYWLLAQEVEKVCGEEAVFILYFYSVDPEQCDKCDTQGVILGYLKEQLKEKLMIFSFDAKFAEEPLMSILTSTYKIKTTPSLVIDGKTHEGLTTKEQILQEICKAYKEEPEICKELDEQL